MRKSRNRARIALALLAGLAVTLVLPGLAQYREYLISGKVVDSQKNSLAGVAINLRDTLTSRSFNLKTKKDGTFKFVGLPHGVYEVVLRKEGFAEKKDEWKFEAPQDRILKVEIPPVVMVSKEVLAEAESLKAAAASVREAAENIKAGDYDGALAKVKPPLEKNPSDANALYIQGLAYQKKRMWPEAVASLARVAELSPAFAAAHYQLGLCYQQMGDVDNALSSYEKNTSLDPSNSDSLYNAGLILFGKSRVDEALARFEKALALRPDDPAYLEMAGRCYINKQDFPKAVAALEKAKALYGADQEKAKFLDELIARLKEQIKKAPSPGGDVFRDGRAGT